MSDFNYQADLYFVVSLLPLRDRCLPEFKLMTSYPTILMEYALKDDNCTDLYFAMFYLEDGSIKFTNITDDVRPAKNLKYHLKKEF